MHVENFVNQGYNEKFTPKLFHAGFNIFKFYFIYLHFHMFGFHFFGHILSVCTYERLSLPGIFFYYI